MEILYEKINRWIPSKYYDNKDRNSLLYLYSIMLGMDFSPLFKQYNQRIKTLEYDFMESVIASGAMCFFGSLLMSICQLGYVKNINNLFTFAACYILTDHYIDDNNVSSDDKKRTIEDINTFVNNIDLGIKDIYINDKTIRDVAEKYISMINKIPSSHYHLKKMFQVEIETMYLQSKDNLSREKYLEISEWKGGLFCNAIQSILELEVTSAEYSLGSLIQGVDDIFDIEDDIHLGINTIATHDYKVYGNLDKILSYCINKTDELDKKYNIFKPVLYLGLAWAVHNNKNMYTPEMVNMMDHFIYYRETTTKKNMILWMKDSIDNSI